MPYIHVPHVFYPYFCSFSIEYKTRQYHCRSLGAVLDTLVKTSAKTAKQGENLQPDLVWNSRQADKLLNLLTAYLSGYVACRIFVPFSYPFLQLHFHQEQMLNLTFMNAEWSLVTHQHLCTVQSPVSIASLCVAVTSPSSPPHPPWLTGILSSALSLSLPPHSLPLSHSSTIRAVCENSSAGRVDGHTEGHSAFCKHNRSYHRR